MTIWDTIDTMPGVALLARLAVLFFSLAALTAVVWFAGRMLRHPR